MYTIKHLGSSVLRPGKKFVICDAGGGTVDLISYEVSRTNNLAVKEVTEGTGGKCGSGMLNKRFRRFLKQTHGEKYWTNERLILAIAKFEAVSKSLLLFSFLPPCEKGEARNNANSAVQTVQERLYPKRRRPHGFSR